MTTVAFGRLVVSSTFMITWPSLLKDVRPAVVDADWFNQFTAPVQRQFWFEHKGAAKKT